MRTFIAVILISLMPNFANASFFTAECYSGAANSIEEAKNSDNQRVYATVTFEAPLTVGRNVLMDERWASFAETKFGSNFFVIIDIETKRNTNKLELFEFAAMDVNNWKPMETFSGQIYFLRSGYVLRMKFGTEMALMRCSLSKL